MLCHITIYDIFFDLKREIDDFKRELQKRAPNCNSSTQRPLPLLCCQMGSGAVGGDRAGSGLIHTVAHEIPAR
ncbi:unnamed protein product, partial [Vitis vinifera]|uniref:Uncharacterized protein n=1 Tax=Vitis vinifera TaxID=29760 RepID=D7T0Q7_VITVI